MRRHAGILLLTLALLALPGGFAVAAGYIAQPQERYRVFVFGDKMATGLLAGLWRVLKDQPKFIARGRLREGSGLARPGFYDWTRTIPKVLDSNPVDIAIVMMGANDARDMRIGGKTVLFGSDEWKAAYGGRVAAVMDAFKARNVALYWVGLPPVRDEGRNEALKFISGIIRGKAKEAGVRFIDIYQDFATPEGGYTENGFGVDGKLTRLRARNGVQFIKPGNTKLASIVMDVIRKDADVAEGRADEASAEAPRAEPAPEKVDENAMPLFGRETPLGGAELVKADDLPDRNAVFLAGTQGAAAADSAAHLSRLRHSAPKDSPAGRLFATGLWPPARKGRIDDFSPAQ